MIDCPTLSLILSIPRSQRWDRWDDPLCVSGCKIDPCISDQYPCCVVHRAAERRPPKFVKGHATICKSDSTWYSCRTRQCRYSKPCESNAALLQCACTPPTPKQLESFLGTPQQQRLYHANPCLKVEARKPLSDWQLCDHYLKEPLVVPRSACSRWTVPKILHTVGRTNTPSNAALMTMAINPDFRHHHLGDKAAGEYVGRNCGVDLYRAYRCFVAPAYRADIARFCMLYHDGGVYLDSDIFLTQPIPMSVSMCSNATLGHDIPQLPIPPLRKNDTTLKGKQMKILAGVKGHPLYKCMIARIVENVRRRRIPRYPLQLTGPTLLNECYEETAEHGIDITYRDSRSAMWPFSGMMGARTLLAFEQTQAENYDEEDIVDKPSERTSQHYHKLYLKGIVYSDTCAL